ncbi:MAG: YdcF family protein [Oscillospiraceae bacterium]|nr:YdcF family protein [Oscillospiraceae bacterium]
MHLNLIHILIVLLFILLALFIAPFFAGIFNMGNIAGIIMTSALIFVSLKYRWIYGSVIVPLKNTLSGRIILSLSGILLIAGISVLIIINCFMISNLNNKPRNANSTVIVLGCKVKGTSPSLMLRRRLDSAYKYLSENPKVKVIVSGGKGSDEKISEAECMSDYLIQKGISPDRIFKEDKSTSTSENLRFSKDIIDKYNLSNNITIVTDGYHQTRARMIAEKIGYDNITSISAPTSQWLIPTYWVREWFGIIQQFCINIF